MPQDGSFYQSRYGKPKLATARRMPAIGILLMVLTACGSGSSSDPESDQLPDTMTSTNNLPLAVADTATTNANTLVTIDLAANDSELQDTPVIFSLDTAPTIGSVTESADGNFIYIPAQDFDGSDSFIYAVTDANGDRSTARVDVTIVASAGTIEGELIAAFSLGQRVANAEVTLLYNNTSVLTDADGRYRFDIPGALPIAEEFLALSITADGYRPREANVELNTENNFELMSQNAYRYFTPVQLNDGIATKNLSETTIDATLINQLMQRVSQPNNSQRFQEVHSLLIYKDGALVVEQYNIGNDDFIRFEDNIARDSSRPDKQWSRTEKHYLASVNKSLTSTIAGIALDAYGLEVDDKISLLLPEKASHFADANNAALSIYHMLTMQLGFEWDEWSSNDLALLWQSNDFTEFLLNRNNAGPESDWVYNSASPNMLLRGLDNTVDGGIRDWAHTNFYSKLGISDYDWLSQPDGIPEGGARMHMRPRDMLKIGITYLNNGVWNNEQVIPANWVADISTVQYSGPDGDYSYFFWHRTINNIPYLSAEGDGGQYINIFPDQNMVIVMTQGNYLEWPLYVVQADDMMGNYILPAVIN